MDKTSWLKQLKYELDERGLSKVERSAVLNYYNEMYQDKLEDGLTANEILKEFGFPQDVADSVLNDGDREKRWQEPRRRTVVERDFDDDTDYEDDYEIYDDGQEDAVVIEEQVESKREKKETYIAGGTVKLLCAIVFGVVFAALIFAFYATTVCLTIAGIGVMIASFTLIRESVWAFVTGVGASLIVFGIGGIFEIFGKLCVKAFKRVTGRRA